MYKKNTAKWQIISEAENLDSDVEFVFELQKAMLLSLLENKQINLQQFEHAIELLEKKKRRRYFSR